MTRLSTLVLASVLVATPVFAQSYVAVGVGADISRSYQSSTNGVTSSSGGDEVVNWALRVGTSVGSQFGVELEFVRPGEVDIENGPIIYAATLSALNAAGVGLAAPSPQIFPGPQLRSHQRNSTWNASAWVRKALTGSADLVFLGGLGFSRVVQDTDYTLFASPLLGGVLPPRSYATRTIVYGVGPLVGAEARLHLTAHLQLTPGVRVHSLGNDLASGLLVRPSVALGWSF